MKFDPLKDQFNQSRAELSVLDFWEANDVFHTARRLAQDRPKFVFYEGPPTANGRPGVHHVISRTVKDLVCRFKAMQGYRVDRKGGWDTHGLPVEIEVEKQLGLDSKSKILEYGVDKFNQKCRESVFKYLQDWNDITRRIGYWLDLDDAYVTLKNDYIESVWWILKNLYDRNLLYVGYKTVPFCPRCGTGLSSHEVAQGYEIVKDPSVFVKMKATDGDFSYLVWTTTPWTLPSNAALCMRPDAVYVTVEHEGEKLVLAEALVAKVFGEEKPALDRKKGTEYVGRRYEPLFDTFKNDGYDAWKVIVGDFVTMEDGTGIVHIAPGYGADDYEIGKQYGLPVLQAVEANGHFREGTGAYDGMFVKDADPLIIKDLKISGKLFKKELYEHNYPFCWRCDSPLIYIARQSWYIKTTQFRDQLLKNNNAVNWVPDEIRTGRMLNWLENNVDWALSRERFWGTPLPIWVCDEPSCGKTKCVGSIEELFAQAASPEHVHMKKAGSYKEFDLHKPGVDAVRMMCECGGMMTRVPEVIDVWFDSGAMPYAQWHYPFENKDVFEQNYPADFISEAVDQTRGWFYSLLAISTMLFDKPAFKNVVVVEFILDKEGKKMSKHKGNVGDPFKIVTEYGADPTRWYLVSNSALWVPTKFDIEGLAEVGRKYFDTLRNTYSFFAIYANIDEVVDEAEKAGLSIEQYLEKHAGAPETFDRWIISKYNTLAREVTRAFEAYEITRPVRAIQYFVIEELSNWYVRNNRRRFWGKDLDPSKMRAYLTLWRVLEGVCRLSAPVSPFTSELIWKELAGANREKHGLPVSVHMMPYPKPDESLIDAELEEAMGLAENIVSLGRAARSRKNLKVRQPLATMMINVVGKNMFARLAPYLEIIEDELNIKKIEAAADLDSYVSYSAKLNFKAAGPKLGGDVKRVAGIISNLGGDQLAQFRETGSLTLAIDDRAVTLTSEDAEILRLEKEGWAVESDGRVTVALSTDLTPDLVDEGFAREMVNKIQNMRKTSGFDVTDHITVRVASTDRLRAAAEKHESFIRQETLAHTLEFIDGKESGSLPGSTEWNINGEKAAIAVAKI